MYEYLGNLPTVELVVELLLKRNAIHTRKWQTKAGGRKSRRIGKKNCIKADQFWKWFRNN